MSRPLITFALISYNQERFIREAVRGAFAQTHSPLEIILSDDCSEDGTFDIMREEASGYDGPHRVLLNRNERNLGIGGHVNRVMEISNGELIVPAAGDDVSLPTRAEELVKVWSKGENFSVYSSYFIVDENGIDRGVWSEPELASVGFRLDKLRSGVMRGLGCADAWSRAVFDTFGPLPEGIVSEDVAIPFRATLLGQIAYLDKCLVKYRRHNANVWKSDDDQLRMDLSQFMEHAATIARRRRKNYESWLRDTQLFLSLHPEKEAGLLQAAEAIAAWREFHMFRESALEGKTMNRLRGCLHTLKRVRKLGIKPIVKTSLIGLSPTIYCKVHQWRYKRLNNRGTV